MYIERGCLMYVWSNVFGVSTLFTIERTFRCATFNDISEEHVRKCRSCLFGVSLSRVHRTTSHAALLGQPLSGIVWVYTSVNPVNYISNGTARIVLKHMII